MTIAKTLSITQEQNDGSDFRVHTPDASPPYSSGSNPVPILRSPYCAIKIHGSNLGTTAYLKSILKTPFILDIP
jgi:hypothetical protein